MLPYFLVTAPVAVMAIVSPRHRRYPLIWGSVFFILLVFIGLRHNVGMDWNNYLRMIEKANGVDFLYALSIAEPGYALILWISGQAGWGVYSANLAAAAIMLYGLFRYAKQTPSPWIALLAALPFLVIVTGMSAARQAMAIGVLLWLVATWSNSSTFKRTIMIFLAASFHMSAIIFLIFVAFNANIRPSLKASFGIFMSAVAIYILQSSGQADYYDSLYGSGQTEVTQSSGALFHVLFNAGPALICFLLGRRARNILLYDPLHFQFAIAALLLIPLALVFSTAAYRVNLYFFPVALSFFSRVPLLFHDARYRLFIRCIISVFFLFYLWFWLSAANSAIAYKNYRNALFLHKDELVLCCK